jgi:hydroxyacylglutathione hydrolase
MGDQLHRARGPSTGEAVVVDPGQHGEQAVPILLERVGLRRAAILLTHAHLDHLWAAPELARTLGVPVHLHPDDSVAVGRPEEAFGPQGAQLAAGFGFAGWDVEGRPASARRRAAARRSQGLEIDVHHTPGHTPGHVVLTTEISQEHRCASMAAARRGGTVLLVGDLLFAGSIGRTDLAGGDPAAMARSLASMHGTMRDETLVIPGHGDATTIGAERAPRTRSSRR